MRSELERRLTKKHSGVAIDNMKYAIKQRSDRYIAFVNENGNTYSYYVGGSGIHDKAGKRLRCGRGGNRVAGAEDMTDVQLVKHFFGESAEFETLETIQLLLRQTE